ncbi:hypothetical protein [Psychroserpens sp.]|uniref:hypothetical protein n=1 Tax=Psychroserpens sp. TaxID=2020870 RepID=UPI001B0200A6|nr:hypothetical protein [Psychroserpens sp.]MBO6606194.1 hypothetical protein [Psychroserpens sp.]MBO6631100.1 hypothetical protein [Psychroserpens sp.]MBO6652434.1 hypothetical protein [Psychroserpens sp.]MBO6681794.1 hypothetical protein [Psychroserpens sp.]MBO6749569.1 hypothetical protein [Psychroserpens sp.]
MTSLAQEQSYQQEINTQVWTNFIKGFNERDNKLFSSVHSKDFIRVIRDNQAIFGYDKAFKVPSQTDEAKRNKWKRHIELRFIESIASSEEAFQVGYYKTSVEHVETKERRVSFGKFHVLLRKENKQWKILMDADVQDGVDEALFQSAKPMKWN